MRTDNHTSKWNTIKTPVKMFAGLAVGAMLMTAIALPSNVSADVPNRPITSEFQLIIQAEIDDAAYVLAPLTRVQQLLVMAEIDDGAHLSGYLSAEHQLMVMAEIDDGFGLEVSEKETNATPSFAEEQLMIQAEMEDGFVGYSVKQVDRSTSGSPGSVFQALLSDEGGSDHSAEQWLVIQAEIEDNLF